jgi:hypothetical protein
MPLKPEAAAHGDKALAGHNPNDLINRERIGWSDGISE